MKPEIKKLILPAETEKLPDVLDFVNSVLEENNCSIKAQMQIEVALEELYVNIAHYAYPDGNGEAEIDVSIVPGCIEITLIDSGIPYDPLAKPDPDITLSAKDRAIGGLGIFMSKKLMDDISYKYIDGKNMLTIKKMI